MNEVPVLPRQSIGLSFTIWALLITAGYAKLQLVHLKGIHAGRGCHTEHAFLLKVIKGILMHDERGKEQGFKANSGVWNGCVKKTAYQLQGLLYTLRYE